MFICIILIDINYLRAVEKELNLKFHDSVESMVKVCDVVTINCPLHPETENLFDDAMISKMKKKAYIVNTARGKICNRDAIAKALKSGQLSGYAGDVGFLNQHQTTCLEKYAKSRNDTSYFNII